MKKALILIVGAALIFIGSIKLFLFIYDKYSEREQLFSTYALSPAEKNMLHDGDIILRHGYGYASDFIVETFNSDINISHCAIIRKVNNKLSIIHSVSQSLSPFDGVQTVDFDKFINDSKMNSVIVVRYKFKPGEDTTLIGKRAQYYLDKKVPFDNDFNLKDSSQIYCAELLYLVFKDSYHFDVFTSPDGKTNYNHLGFQAFLDTTRFKVIINHHLRDKKK